MSDAFHVAEVRHKKLAAPEFPIQTKPEPVESNADYFALDLVVGHATGYVRMVVLNRELIRHRIERLRIFCRQVFGMQIVGDHFRIDIKQMLVVFDSLPERTQCFEILKVANVMTHKSAVSACETKCVL